MTSQTFTL